MPDFTESKWYKFIRDFIIPVSIFVVGIAITSHISGVQKELETLKLMNDKGLTFVSKIVAESNDSDLRAAAVAELKNSLVGNYDLFDVPDDTVNIGGQIRYQRREAVREYLSKLTSNEAKVEALLLFANDIPNMNRQYTPKAFLTMIIHVRKDHKYTKEEKQKLKTVIDENGLRSFFSGNPSYYKRIDDILEQQ